MRRGRRGGQGNGHEFGGSGEDSFVAVVVTKLTGALLFILLLTMVIMALLPKAIDLPSPGKTDTPPLAIATPGNLPEAIAGRPYRVALAASGGQGPLHWAVDGELPVGLTFDPKSALLSGTPKSGTPRPVPLTLRVSDGHSRTASQASLVVYSPDRPLTVPSKWAPKLPPVPVRSWLDQGFGFLVLLLVHMVGMNTLSGFERWSTRDASDESSTMKTTHMRFLLYRWAIRLATVGAMVALGLWLIKS